MTDWKYYNSSKYAAKCCYCNRDIHTSEGRWNAVKDETTGKGRWNACHNCIPPPETGQDASPPDKPTQIPSSVPSSSTPAKPSSEEVATTSYTPENRIAKQHDENMLSEELTRQCITKLIASLDNICNEIHTRTTVLQEQIKKGG